VTPAGRPPRHLAERSPERTRRPEAAPGPTAPRLTRPAPAAGHARRGPDGGYLRAMPS